MTSGMDMEVDSASFYESQESVALGRLRAIKNSLIGNPSAKSLLVLSEPSTIRACV